MQSELVGAVSIRSVASVALFPCAMYITKLVLLAPRSTLMFMERLSSFYVAVVRCHVAESKLL